MQSQEKSAKERKGVYIRTFGCQMNEYDSAKLFKILAEEYKPVSDPADAELVLINTCSVRDKPERKLYSLLGEVKQLKQKNPDLLIGVGGCVAQQEGEQIVKRSKDVDLVFGTHNLSLVPSLVSRRRQGHEPQVAIDYRDEWEELPLGFSEEDTEHSRVSAFVSISRGCNKNCSYCIVPTTRGKEVSRAPEEILREVRIAAHRGAREIVLLGQTVNSYGLDLQPRMRFSQLLDQVAEIGGVERIRFTSPHPQEVRADFFDLVARNPKVCRHIHMPLQSGSDRILKLMNRNYRRKRYLSIIEELQSRVPDIAITSDIIVGFPSETREDFEETLDLMRQVPFHNSFSFMFSARPGTLAAGMPDDVPHQEKLSRLQELQALQLELTKCDLERWRGKHTQVLIEGASTSDPSKLKGRNSQNITVNLTERVEGLSAGDFIDVRVTECSRFTLKGQPVVGAA
jgi:tRNA-2-methylthio-N6-dimethylallyladenosine synthase